MAAMMGAEEFGIGTAALVAMGCIMVRQCHSNTCPVGVCTQDEKLREKFTGTAEKVVNLFSFIAEEVREILASLGFRKLEDVIGRTDLLYPDQPRRRRARRSRSQSAARAGRSRQSRALLDREGPQRSARLRSTREIEKDAAKLLQDGEKMQLTYTVRNTMRSIGARISCAHRAQMGHDGTCRPDI